MDTGPYDQLAKALLHRPHLVAIARGEFLPPVSVKIELTNVCNHDCHFCAYRAIVQEPRIKDMLDLDRTLDLVDELAAGGVKGLTFTGGGEPLLHPGVASILARCRARGIAHALITNGSRLGRLDDEALAGMRWIRFSINAGDPETYVRVHGAGAADWDRVWSEVARASDAQRFPGLFVGVSFVATTWNIDGMERAARLARDAGVRSFHVRPAFVGPHTQLDRQLASAEIRACFARLEALGALSNDRFRVHGIERRFREIESHDRAHVHCRSTPLLAYVLPNADVSICTLVRAASFNPAVPDPFLGNLKRARFFDLWGTDKHRAIIRGLSTSGCTRCHFAEYNRALALVEEDGLHESFL